MAREGQEDSMRIRLDFLEALIEDNEDKHAKEIEAAQEKLGDLCKAIVDCPWQQLASVEARMNALEKSLVESTDKLQSSQTAHGVQESMQLRLDFLEALTRESADKLGYLGKELVDGAKHDQLASVEKRMRSLENLFLESAASVDKRMNSIEKSFLESAEQMKSSQTAHGEHEESMKTRLKFLEVLVRENADKHAKELLDANNILRYLSNEIANGAKHDQLVSIVEARMNSAEKSFLESADKHAKELLEAKDKIQYLDNEIAIGAKHDQLVSVVEARMNSVEKSCLESADKHAKELLDAKDRIRYLDNEIANGAKHDQLVSVVEARMNSVEKSLLESADTWKSSQIVHGEAMNIRLDLLEELIKDNADTYAKGNVASREKLEDLDKAIADCAKHHNEFEALREKLEDLGKAISDCAKHDQLATIEERISFLLEKYVRLRVNGV